MRAALRLHAPPCLLLAIAPFALFGRALLGHTFIPGPDLLANFTPWLTFFQRELAQGRFPLWDPHAFCGAPFITNSQVAHFYPFTLLPALFDVVWALHVTMAVHVYILGLGMYALAWRCTRDPWAALLAAVLVTASQHLACKLFYGVVCNVYVIAWMPWIWWLLLRLLDAPSPRRAVGLGLAGALQVLGGHPQWVLMTGYAAAAMILFRAVVQRESGRAWAARGAALLLAAALSLAVPAAQLLPAVDVAAHSATRAGGAGYEFATIDSLPPAQLLSWTMPLLFGNPSAEGYWLTRFGYHELGCATGVISLLLVIVALRQRRDALAWALAVGAGVAIVLALGRYTPLYHAVYHLPGVAYFRVPARWLALALAALALLAARGLALVRAEARARRTAAWAAVALFVAHALLWLFLTLAPDAARERMIDIAVARLHAEQLVAADADDAALRARFDTRRFDLYRKAAATSAATATAVAASALVVVSAAARVQPSSAAAVLLLLAAGELLTPALLLLRQEPRSALRNRYYRVSPAVAHVVENSRGRALLPDRTISVVGRTAHPELVPERTTVMGLRSTRGYNPTIVRAIADYTDRLARRPPGQMPGGLLFIPDPPELDRDLLNRMAADYVLAYEPPGAGYTRELVDDGLGVYRNEQAWPRAVLCNTAGELLSATAAVIVRDEPNTVTIRCAWDAPVRLVLLDTMYPGWEAWRGGEPLRVEPYLDTFRQVALDAGRHEVQFRFRPRALRVGLWISVAGVLVAAVAAWFGVPARARGSQGARRTLQTHAV